MSMNEGLARPWAAAVFARSQETKRQDNWAQMLLVLQQAVATDVWKRIAMDARRDYRDQAQALIDACGDLLDDEGRNLVRLLAKFRRIDILAELRKQFLAWCDRKAGVVEVQLVSAFPTGDDAAILAALRTRFGGTIRLEKTVDPQLIGGVIIRQGDRVLDGSVAGSLERTARYLRV